MEPYGRNPAMEGSQPDPAADWNSPGGETGIEESVLHMRLGSRELYPDRPNELDCAYYMRTGFCGYGARCRYNHPRDHSAVVGSVRPGGGGEYPERVGQPPCQYYLKTGTCKYGASCKYDHPRHGGGSMSRPMSLNIYGYPLRPGEKECSYYVKTGHCKFGVTCKFHHPQPAGASMPAPAPAFYQTVQSPSVPSPQQYGGVAASWQVTRPPLLPGSYLQGPYGSVLLSPGVVQIPGWSPYAPVSPIASPDTQPTVGTSPIYRVTQLSPSAPAYAGPYPPLPSSAGPSSSGQKEDIFPERPGQPECQYYLRTGECRYGSTCRYHHPPKTNYVLSSQGLPIRPGAPPCTFYVRHRACKYGPTCKFDHSVGTLSYSSSASSLADMPVVPYPVGSSLATLAPSSSSSELRPEFVSGSKDSFSTRMPSSENTPSGSVGSIFSKSGTVPRSNIQLSGQSSAPSSGSSSTSHGGEAHSSG